MQPRFSLDGPDEPAAVTEICQRLDGIALAIELAAARMVSMSAQEVLDHLDDRFRLLSGTGRGPQHHQTLLTAVSWSYDLLDGRRAEPARPVLRCSPAGSGWPPRCTSVRTPRMDRLAVLDLLDSLVRKSLITAEPVSGQTRYGLLETIRHFGEDQLDRQGITDEVRHLHASYFAAEATAAWERWNGPEQRVALDWVEREFADLRAAFRWATDHDDLSAAASIAAHTTLVAMVLQRFEPVGWAVELLPAAVEADLTALPACTWRPACARSRGGPTNRSATPGRPRRSRRIPGTTPSKRAGASRGRPSGIATPGVSTGGSEICDVLVAQEGLAHLIGLIFSTAVLPGVGRSEEARAVADDAVGAARARQNPFWIAFALEAYARAYADKDPGLAMDAMDEVLDYTREHRLPFFEANTLREIAALEAVLGDPGQALELFDSAVASYHRAGNHGSVATTLAQVAVLFSQHRPARDRRDDLRHQHPPRRQHDRQPARGGGAPPRRARRRCLRTPGRHRGGDGVRRGDGVRPRRDRAWPGVS